MTSYAAEMRRIAREQARAQREYERALVRQAKEEARAYVESRADEAESGTAEIKEREEDIRDLLLKAVDMHIAYDFEGSKKQIDATTFESTVAGLVEPQEGDYEVAQPSWLGKLVPGSGWRFRRRQTRARAAYEERFATYKDDLARQKTASQLFYAHQKRENEKSAQHNSAIDELRAAVARGTHDAIVTFYSDVCNGDLREEFDAVSAEVGYSEISRHLVIDLELPSIEAVPAEAGFRYVKSADRIDSIQRPAAKRKAIYANLIAQISLKCISRTFTALRTSDLNCVTLNAMLDGIDPATGNDVRACLVSVSITPDTFSQLNLRQVQPEQCLKMLKASVSRAPAEMAPVKPLVELDMVDPRFVATTNVMSSIDGRPNLMDLSPGEFEGLITNLFGTMGLETRQTRASRDGGVDCVAFDQRPIFGGKVVIQAKRYKGTVGVSAVRDLFGTVQNEGASKGILVTTSGYGKASFDFARGKPLELLDGGNLLHLLMEHAQIDAKIVMPDDWKDGHLHLD